MDTDSLSIARWQFRMVWRLADEVHLPRLTDAMCQWQPHPGSWTVHCAPDGRWLPDWADEDPVEPPPPSVGWLTWHVIWWWSSALAVVRGSQPVLHEDVAWPGSADCALAEIRRIGRDWRKVIGQLSDAAVQVPVAFPWPDPRPLIYTVSWVNMELMKNVAEIGEVANMFTNRSA
ncbi:MAG TPA: DinB family protein [Jatrophihabitans sp.]